MVHTTLANLKIPNHFTKELKLTNYKFYFFTLVFSIGNIALPMLCHQFNLAGNRFLPIYFFILIAGYLYGWRMGLLTAILSPLFSYLLTGMPVISMLTMGLIKGSALGIVAGLIGNKYKKISLINIGIIIILYQSIGLLFASITKGNLNFMASDFVIGFPGLLIQLFGGFLVLKFLSKHL